MAGIGDYDKKSKGSRGYKMKGFSQHKGISPTKKLDDPSSGDQSHTVEKVGETEAEKKARLKREKKAERKESRKDWRKRTAGRIKDEAISAGTEVLKGAAINALTPKEKKIVNPAAGFNVQFGR
jgi:hypothetical protein